MAPSHLTALLKEVVPIALAVAAVLSGFVLLRVAAMQESYLILFLAFALMIWGVVALFTGRGRPRGASYDLE